MIPNPLSLIYLLAILVGVLFVSISAFWRKMKAGEFDSWTDFNVKYMILMLFSVIASVIATFLLYAIYPLQVSDPPLVFAAGLLIGMSSKQTLEEIWKHIDPDWWAT
jgi:zinc transporter ZupT